jgi:ABC-type antimicrobial peptide transport system permease subunit
MSAFGGVALLLAAIGLYGLVAYSVEQRTHEIGIRLALGAETTEVRNMVLRQGVPLIVIGVGSGLIAAFFLAKLLAALLFGVEPHDALVFVGVPVALASIALFAAAVAARRAIRVTPIAALRYE